jgi:hypothetical protein
MKIKRLDYENETEIRERSEKYKVNIDFMKKLTRNY